MKHTSPAVPMHATAESFEEEVLRSELPVLVDFWAPWCPPCMMLKPEVERLSADLGGRVRVALVNVDEEPELARMFNVSGIPALMIIKDGRRVDGWTGYSPRAAMMARIEKQLPGKRR
jgi:thioredoxin 1